MQVHVVNYSHYVFLLIFEREGDQDYKGMHVVVQLELVLCISRINVSLLFLSASPMQVHLSIYPGLLTLYEYY